MEEQYTKYKLAIFDVDGTLTEIRPEVRARQPRLVTPNHLGEQQPVLHVGEVAHRVQVQVQQFQFVGLGELGADPAYDLGEERFAEGGRIVVEHGEDDRADEEAGEIKAGFVFVGASADADDRAVSLNHLQAEDIIASDSVSLYASLPARPEKLSKSFSPLTCSGTENEKGEKYPKVYKIDLLRCIFCGYCVEACPVEAIEMTGEYELANFHREDFTFDKKRLVR